MDLVESVISALDVRGALAQSIPEFKHRAGQTEMALAVATTLRDGGTLVVEAGTGIGKTFAYLVPALLSGERVLVSTATKALQDQLFSRDLPRLTDTLGIPVRIALLKGRNSYVCGERLERAKTSPYADDFDFAERLDAISVWAQQSIRGDLAEFSALNEQSILYPLVTSTRDNCLGNQCPKASGCFVNQARKDALAADLVVINHHLFFADLNIRESGVAELLPQVRTVIFDEAHQLNDIGVQFLGESLSSRQILDLGRDLRAASSSLVLGAENIFPMLSQLEASMRLLDDMLKQDRQSARKVWTGMAPHGVDGQEWEKVLGELSGALTGLREVAFELAQTNPGLMSLHRRLESFSDKVQLFGKPPLPGFVRWVEGGQSVRWTQSPLNIAGDMQKRVFNEVGDSVRSPQSWVFTSATLGHDDSLSWFVDTCGLQHARILKVESPFDHASQSSLYIPSDFPKPNDASHSARVAALVADAASALGGRTLVLTTTLAAMASIGQALKLHFSGVADLDVLLQGDAPKHDLISRFEHAGRNTDKGCILVGSASFWEGIDLPGDALQMVVIDKLPFAPPGDPLMEARSVALTDRGLKPFQSLHLPHAAVALKQGAGRLIRRESDRGILVVCDVRLSQMGYGRRLIAALPPMRRLHTDDAFYEQLKQITKLSTRDPHHP